MSRSPRFPPATPSRSGPGRVERKPAAPGSWDVKWQTFRGNGQQMMTLQLLFYKCVTGRKLSDKDRIINKSCKIYMRLWHGFGSRCPWLCVHMNGSSWNRSVQVKNFRERLHVVQMVIILHIRKLHRFINIRQVVVLRTWREHSYLGHWPSNRSLIIVFIRIPLIDSILRKINKIQTLKFSTHFTWLPQLPHIVREYLICNFLLLGLLHSDVITKRYKHLKYRVFQEE